MAYSDAYRANEQINMKHSFHWSYTLSSNYVLSVLNFGDFPHGKNEDGSSEQDWYYLQSSSNETNIHQCADHVGSSLRLEL